MISLQNINKFFNDGEEEVCVARDLCWTLPLGQTAALLGDSGSGKTTILHILAGLEVIDSGEVFIGDTNISAFGEHQLSHFRRNHIGLVFQKFHLVPSLNVWDNAALQARIAACFDIEYARHLLESLGISHLAHRFPQQLSGGQQQRVAIARALMSKPELILSDEPTGSLDEKTSDRVISLLIDSARDIGATLLVVTHSDTIANNLDARWRLERGQVSEMP